MNMLLIYHLLYNVVIIFEIRIGILEFAEYLHFCRVFKHEYVFYFRCIVLSIFGWPRQEISGL